MPEYTFCFARDLTGKQQQLFEKHLVGRHEGVTVNWWGASRLVGYLLDSPQGERIERRFWGDPKIDTAAVMNALRAGGALETGSDAIARLRAIADFFETHDPYFDYVSTTHPLSIQPGITPGSVMSVEVTSQDKSVRIDAVPRNRAALDQLPSGRFIFKDTPEGRADLERFEQAVRVGGETSLTGTDLEFDRLPQGFRELIAPVGYEITITAQIRHPAPWNARISVATDLGEGEVDIELKPGEPPTDWEHTLIGSVGGLTLRITLRVRDGRGQVGFRWEFQATDGETVAAQAQALAFVEALHGDGTLTITDRDGGNRTVSTPIRRREIDPRLVFSKQLIDDLLVIEQWTVDRRVDHGSSRSRRLDDRRGCGSRLRPSRRREPNERRRVGG
jgi:hypothetical protein